MTTCQAKGYDPLADLRGTNPGHGLWVANQTNALLNHVEISVQTTINKLH